MRLKQVEQMNRIKLYNRIMGTIGFTVLLIGIFVNHYFLILVPIIAIFINPKKLSDKRYTIYLGYKGEQLTVKALKALPNEFLIYQFTEIKHKNKNINLDHIVIGPTGLFLVKSTYRQGGTYYGRTDDQEWILDQSVRRKVKNPIKVVKWQTYELSEYLKSKGFNHYIQPIVFLSDTGSLYDSLQIDDFPVHHNRKNTPNTIAPYIQNYDKGKGLSKKDIKELALLFSRLGVRNQ